MELSSPAAKQVATATQKTGMDYLTPIFNSCCTSDTCS